MLTDYPAFSVFQASKDATRYPVAAKVDFWYPVMFLHVICVRIIEHTCSWIDIFFINLMFMQKQDGATLMHYAVQTASSQAIKILLLYNVAINHQDNVWLTIPPCHLHAFLIKFWSISWVRLYLSNSGWVDTITSCCPSPEDWCSEALIDQRSRQDIEKQGKFLVICLTVF